jgi:hypothetical protein
MRPAGGVEEAMAAGKRTLAGQRLIEQLLDMGRSSGCSWASTSSVVGTTDPGS